MTTESITLRPLVEQDEPAVLDLLTAAMAGGPTGVRSAEYFRWKHRDNPFGSSPGLVAVHEDVIVGARLFMRWQLEQDGVPIRAVRAVDTATHPDFQRQGIFRRLTLELLERLDSDRDVDLVFNTPNADSHPGYVRMGWTDVDTLPLRICPARPLAFLSGVRGATGANASGSADAVAAPRQPAELTSCDLPFAAEVLEDGPAITELLGRRRPDPRIRTRLSLGYLRWRYGQAPGLDYRGIAVRRAGVLVGLAFGRRRSRADLTELTLGDVVIGDGDLAVTASILKAARRSGVHHVALHTPPRTELARRALRSGYLPTPGRGIRLVANPRTERATAPLAPESWSLSLGDLELF